MWLISFSGAWMLWSVLIRTATVLLSVGDVSFLFGAGCYMHRRQVRYH